MLKRNNISSIFVLDQDEALRFYTEVLGLEVADDMNFGPMRWLTVRVPGDEKAILLEKPGLPAHDEATAEQIRALVTKGAGGGWLAFTTDDVEVPSPGSRTPALTSPRTSSPSPTVATSPCATRSATTSGSARSTDAASVEPVGGDDAAQHGVDRRAGGAAQARRRSPRRRPGRAGRRSACTGARSHRRPCRCPRSTLSSRWPLAQRCTIQAMPPSGIAGRAAAPWARSRSSSSRPEPRSSGS